MKNNHKISITFIVYIFLSVGLFSCKKENKNPPTLRGVYTISKLVQQTVSTPVTLDSNRNITINTLVPFDSLVINGSLNGVYAIKGQNLATTTKVVINGMSIYFNPALLTDNSIILTIPLNAPWGPGQPSKLTVTTLYGTATLDFGINQPAPVITDFTPASAPSGSTITITGTAFDNLVSVKFDTTSAVVVSATSTKITALVPNNISIATIYVTTPGGTAKASKGFGLTHIIYDDAIAAGWDKLLAYGYSGTTVDIANTNPVKRGSKSIAVVFTNTYGAFEADYNGTTINVAQLGLTSVQFAAYGGAGYSGQITVALNGNYTSTQRFYVNLVPGAWTTFTIPLTAFGSPTTITSFILQNRGAPVPETFYLDDIGFK